tara:strand:+ start:91 stop:696 length:606 start_codon:yes stop_codon:yes gene_type:complete
MLDIGFFYLLLLVLIILLIFVILLYSGFHYRVLAPAIMNANYGLSLDGAGSIGTTFQKLYLNDGVSVSNNAFSGVSGGIDFGISGSSDIPFEFLPLMEDRNRTISGKIVLYGYSRVSDDVGTSICLAMIDEGDNNRQVAQPTDYNFKGFDYGLQKFELVFNSGRIDNNKTTHQFVLQGKTNNGGTIPSNRLLLNSAYLHYY